MKKLLLICAIICLFIGCSKDNPSVPNKTLQVEFRLGDPVSIEPNGHTHNSFYIFYNNSIDAELEATINLTGSDFDTTFTVKIESNYTSSLAVYGSGNKILGIAKGFNQVTSKEPTSGKMLDIKCSDPSYKLEVISNK